MGESLLRRQFLRAGVAGVAMGMAAGAAVAAPNRPVAGTAMKGDVGASMLSGADSPFDAASAAADAIARLAFMNTHTSESLSVVYRDGDRYLTEAMARIDRVLRDHRTGEVHPIDPALLDQLDRLAGLLGVGKQPYHVISGYRSPTSNARLAARSGGVATRSLHMSGRAIDIRIPGVPLARVREAALDMKVGGVGYYPKSDFVHLDTGRVRHWRG